MTQNADLPRPPADELSDREMEMWRLRVVNRWTQSRIAEQFGVSRERVGQILARVRELMPAPDPAAVRAEALALHENVIERALTLAEMDGAPVFVGKDGDLARDPEHGEAVVRDYSGRIAALKLALAADGERRKLLGLDSATKIESTATVRYVLEGVNTDDLA